MVTNLVTILCWCVVLLCAQRFKAVRDQNTRLWSAFGSLVLFFASPCFCCNNRVPSSVKMIFKETNDLSKGFLALFASLVLCSAIGFYVRWAIMDVHPLECPSMHVKYTPNAYAGQKVPRQSEPFYSDLLFRWACVFDSKHLMEPYKGDADSYALIKQGYEFEDSTDDLHFPIPMNYTSFTFYRGCAGWVFMWQCQVHVYPETAKRAAIGLNNNNHTIAKQNRPTPSPVAVVIGIFLILIAFCCLMVFSVWILCLIIIMSCIAALLK